MSSLSLVVMVLAGLAALLFGRQLFWLFVGIVGFLVGFELATRLITGQPDWIILLIALVAGLLGALLAVFLQYVAVAVAGFLAGGYALFTLLRTLDLMPDMEWARWGLLIVGGIIGAALILLLYDWALIVLSAGTGAATLTAIYPDAGNPFALTHLRDDEGLGAWTGFGPSAPFFFGALMALLAGMLFARLVK